MKWGFSGETELEVVESLNLKYLKLSHICHQKITIHQKNVPKSSEFSILKRFELISKPEIQFRGWNSINKKDNFLSFLDTYH